MYRYVELPLSLSQSVSVTNNVFADHTCVMLITTGHVGGCMMLASSALFRLCGRLLRQMITASSYLGCSLR